MKIVAQFVKGLKYLDPRDWGWMHFKIVLGGLLPVTAFIMPPTTVRDGLIAPFLMHVILGMMIAGGIFSLVGVLLRGTKVQPLIVGYSLELGGLIFLGSSAILLTIGYAYAAYIGDSTALRALFCYTIFAALLARFIDVYFHTLQSKQPGDPLISRE